MQELKRNGLAVPDKVKVVGFCNENYSKYLEVPLSTVDQKPIEMGREAAEIFKEAISGNIQSYKYRILTPDLIIRESSKGKCFGYMQKMNFLSHTKGVSILNNGSPHV